jgi:hypothetical protein
MAGGAIVGAVIGGVVAAVKGESILKGALFGGLVGAAAGGALGWAATSMAAANGATASMAGQTGQAASLAGGTETGMSVAGTPTFTSAGVPELGVAVETTAVDVAASEMTAAELQLAMTKASEAAAATAGKYGLAGAAIQGVGGLFGPDEEQMAKDAEKARKDSMKVTVGEINRVKGTATFDPTKYDVNKWYQDLPSDILTRQKSRYTSDNVYKKGAPLTGDTAPASTGAPKPSATSPGAPKPQPQGA